MHHHDSKAQKSIALTPKHRITADQANTEQAMILYQRESSRLHISDNFRLNSQPTAACITPLRSLGGSGWPAVIMHNQDFEKATCIWMNTTPGLINHWAVATHTQNGLSYASTGQMSGMPVLDVTALSSAQIEALTHIYEHQHAETSMMPACDAWQDPSRQEIDRKVLQDVLGMGPETMVALAAIRDQWCQEPTVQGKMGATAPQAEKMLRLQQAAENSRKVAEARPARLPKRHRNTPRPAARILRRPKRCQRPSARI